MQKTSSYYRAPDESWKERLRSIPDVQAMPYSVRRASDSFKNDDLSDDKLVFTRISTNAQNDGQL